MTNNPYGPSDNDSTRSPQIDPAADVNLSKNEQAAPTHGNTLTEGPEHAPQRAGRHNGGFWLLFAGAMMLLSVLGMNFSERLWGLFCFVPLIWALWGSYRCYRSSGELGGNMWWVFGSLFPAAAGLGILFSVDVNYTLVVALGFIAMGAITMLGRRR